MVEEAAAPGESSAEGDTAVCGAGEGAMPRGDDALRADADLAAAVVADAFLCLDTRPIRRNVLSSALDSPLP